MNVFNQPVFVILQFSLKKKKINRLSFPWGVAALSWANPETTNYRCTAHEFQPTVWSQHPWPSWPQALPHLSSRAMSAAKGQGSFPASSGEPRLCPGWNLGPYHMEEWCNSPLLRWMGCCQSRMMQWLKPRLPGWWQLRGADPLGPSGKEQIIAVLHIIAALINHTHGWCDDRTCGTHRAVSLSLSPRRRPRQSQVCKQDQPGLSRLIPGDSPGSIRNWGEWFPATPKPTSPWGGEKGGLIFGGSTHWFHRTYLLAEPWGCAFTY